MLIRVSAGNCRVAVAAAIAQVEGILADDFQQAKDKCFQQLHNGFCHNQTRPPSDDDLNMMKNMADTDAGHMMEQHPGKTQLFHLNRMQAMLNYTKDDDVVLDDSDFGLLQEHLPEADAEGGI